MRIKTFMCIFACMPLVMNVCVDAGCEPVKLFHRCYLFVIRQTRNLRQDLFY